MWCSVVFVLIVCVFSSTRAEIVLEHNGYEGIVVAIHNSIKEDAQIVENIKDLFRSASKFLYVATNQRAHFRCITLALPPHWSDKPDYINVTGNYFPNAHVRVDHPNPEYGAEPYTLQTGGCGEEGKYIHLSSDYIKGLNSESHKKYGPPGRRLVQEWARLRYGVFDENGYPDDDRHPFFYRQDKEILPTACAKNIRGSRKTKEGKECHPPKGKDIDNNCLFIPSQDNDVTTSLMFKPYVPSIDSFCNNTNHNIFAPNKHNEMCNSASVWSVMERHQDFFSNSRSTSSDDDLRPTFRIVKPKGNDRGRYVLVLDVTKSETNDKIEILHDASTVFIEAIVPEGAYLGIVSLGKEARIVHDLTMVDTDTRFELTESVLQISLDDNSITAIGEGLQRGIEVLEGKDNITEGATILLVTDGEDDAPPYIQDIIPNLESKKIVVNCIAFGNHATEKLEELSQSRGGKSFFVSAEETSTEWESRTSGFDTAFRKTVSAAVEEELQHVQITQKGIHLNETETHILIPVDPELGLKTTFALNVAETSIGQVEMSVKSPSGQTFDPKSGGKVYSVHGGGKLLQIRIEVPVTEAGMYNVTLIGKNGWIRASLTVTSEPRDPKNPPIRLRSWLSPVNTIYREVKVFAELKRGYEAVTGVSVVAEVMDDDESIALTDDGVGADVTENDGVYSAYVTRFRGEGRYEVITRAASDGLLAKMKFSRRTTHPKEASLSSAPPTNSTKSRATESVPSNSDLPNHNVVSRFERIEKAGTFLGESWSSHPDQVLPSDFVRDLMITEAVALRGWRKKITLQWTSPANDEKFDKDSRVELRVNCNMESLVHNFEDSSLVNDTWVTNGSLTPEPSLHKQKLTILIPDHLTRDSNCSSASSSVISLYFALRVRDDSNNVGRVSVVASAHFLLSSSSSSSYSSSSTQGLIVALVIIVIVIVLGVIIYVMRKRRREIFPISNEK